MNHVKREFWSRLENKLDWPCPFAQEAAVMRALASLKRWARHLEQDVLALWIAARDPRVPWYAKALAGAVAAYALSPIDLIPDFVPVLGYLDDLLIVPAGIWLATRLIPLSLMSEFRAEASRRSRPKSRVAMAVVMGIWFAAGAGLWLLFLD
jgi:uncharacterized membrane protein YkvA (DUF1232 family)